MPLVMVMDILLNNLWRNLLERLEASPDGSCPIVADNFPSYRQKTFDLLVSAGLLEEGSPLSEVECDGCHQRCIMPIEIWEPKNKAPEAFIVCDKEEKMGRITVGLDRLKAHTFTLDRLAAWLAKALPTDRNPIEIIPGDLWNLGCHQIRSDRHEIFLCRTLEAGRDTIAKHPVVLSAYQPVILSLRDTQVNYPIPLIGLTNLYYFVSGKLLPYIGQMAKIIRSHRESDQVALEIEWINGTVVLNNRINDQRKTLAQPDFGSRNYDLFECLLKHEGKTLGWDQLVHEAEVAPGMVIHKFIENLGFKGVLRKIFFQTSQNKICFHRTISRKKLTSLAIDPLSILEATPV